LSFVVFDPSTGTRGKPTQVIYVGSTEPGTSHLFRGTDGGATFTNSYEVTGLPAVRSGGDRGGRGGGGGARVVAVGGREGDLWVVGEALCHSGDGGRTFREIPNHPPISARSSIIPMSFGKAAPGKDYPAIFVANQRGSDSAAAGIYRSDDKGATWVRINDAQHRWGIGSRGSAIDPQGMHQGQEILDGESDQGRQQISAANQLGDHALTTNFTMWRVLKPVLGSVRGKG
jgi:hypothetical protein